MLVFSLRKNPSWLKDSSHVFQEQNDTSAINNPPNDSTQPLPHCRKITEIFFRYTHLTSRAEMRQKTQSHKLPLTSFESSCADWRLFDALHEIYIDFT